MIQTCALLDWHSRNKRFSSLKKHMHRRHVLPHQRICTNGLDHPVHTHQAQIGTISHKCFQLLIYTEKLLTCQSFNGFIHLQVSTMEASEYWPFAWEYSLWNAAVAALQFWMAVFEPHILSNAINRVYAAFFYSDFTQQIWNLPEEILFGPFVTTLNDASDTELAQEGEGYESGSENFNIPHSSQNSTESLPSLNKGRLILWSCTLSSITNYTGAAWRDLTSQIQTLQPFIPPISVHQFRWWESCETQCKTQSML